MSKSARSPPSYAQMMWRGCKIYQQISFHARGSCHMTLNVHWYSERFVTVAGLLLGFQLKRHRGPASSSTSARS